ncbi:Catalase-like protein [Leptotrombidium deliense]|uniref:Catalase-like protein n=1 Tax=Leptotrombidium deliense TaxID=299467 RepID=A0A443S6J8_9ACAR|nr:Catalase-like protein [Leptotrombidium deliense]
MCDRSLNQVIDFAESDKNYVSFKFCKLRNISFAKKLIQQETITELSGAKIGDKLNSMTCGKRGPVLLQDTILLEELRQFDVERIPERVVHAKGGGAFGTFIMTHQQITNYTKAAMFSHVGKETPVFIRFSTVAGELGSADTVRDVRGFAIKFYTDDGIWDLVGNNCPTGPVKDPIRFPSAMRSRKRNPRTHLPDRNAFWDFASLLPETVHQLMFLFSERGIPDGFRHMHGFSINTFKLVNAKNDVVYTRFFFRTNQGIKNIEPPVAQRLAAENRDYSIRDLYNAIENGEYPSWTCYVQIMTFEEAKNWYYNPFDATKVWPHKEFPLVEVGQLILNRNPVNYFAEVEQSAFNPANIPYGIEPSPDMELHGRLFSYVDTQRYRLGAHAPKLPVNRPNFRTVTPTIRDGKGVFDDNFDGFPNYYPNSYSNAKTDKHFVDPAYRVTNTPDVDRYDTTDEDNFDQPKIFWETVLNDKERKNMIQAIANHMKEAQLFIQRRAVAMLSGVHEDLGNGVWEQLRQLNTTRCT